MKFTEEQAVENLIAKMTSKGETLHLSERTLKSNIKLFYKRFATEETELDDFIKDVLPDFKELEGNANKNQADFVNSYKPKEKEPEKKDKGKEEDEDKYSILLREIEALKQEKEAEKTAKSLSQKKEDLKEAIKTGGVKDEKWISKYLNMVAINPESDIETLSKTAVEFYNIQESRFDQGSTPRGSGSSSESQNSFFEEIRREREEELKNKTKI